MGHYFIDPFGMLVMVHCNSCPVYVFVETEGQSVGSVVPAVAPRTAETPRVFPGSVARRGVVWPLEAERIYVEMAEQLDYTNLDKRRDMPWLASHAARQPCMGSVAHYDQTSYEVLQGKPYQVELAEFGELR